MEEFASLLWNYQEMEDLRYMLFHASLELDRLRAEATEEREKNREYTKQLIHLLKITCKERDEARDDLQKLLASGVMTSSESNAAAGFSDRRSASSSAESLLDVASPPRGGGRGMWGGMESLGEGKPLPQNGKFLQAVLEAGPLLQTVMVTGPLPRWRNPPRVVSLPVPPVSIKAESFCGQTLAPNPMLGFDGFGGHYGHLGKRQRLQ